MVNEDRMAANARMSMALTREDFPLPRGSIEVYVETERSAPVLASASDLHWRHPHRLRPESTEILIVAKATPEKDASFLKSRSVLHFRNGGSKREIGGEGETAPKGEGGDAAAAVVNGGERRRGRGRISGGVN
ncbi:hypothetical protein U1Q18_008036 [Sarracenia purpurea var. burkii]